MIDWKKAFEIIDHLVWLKEDVAYKAPEAQGPCNRDLARSVMKLADVVNYGPTKEERDLVVAVLTNEPARSGYGLSGPEEKILSAFLKKLGEAGDPTRDGTTEHPPITSYTLGQRVSFHPGRGDHWRAGMVTRLESGLHANGSTWHTIFVCSTRDLPEGEWEHAGAYKFEDGDDSRVRPRIQP
jgi:hypothetical protein